MSQDLSPLLEFWGLKEEELNEDVFLSASSVFSRRRRLATTLPYSEFATSTSEAVKPGSYRSYTTTDCRERTLQRDYDQQQVEEDFQRKSTRVTVPHASVEAGNAENADSGEYDGETTESTSAVSIVCVNCAHCNVGGVNWCLECGTAVTGAKSQPLLAHSLSQTPPNPKSTHRLDIMPTEFHSGVKSCPQLSAKQFASNLDVVREVSSIPRCTGICTERHLARTDSTNSRRKLVFSVNSPPGQYTSRIQTSNVRCWNTSGLYMWRKPSSLKSVQSSPCRKSTLAEPGYQTNSSDSIYNKSHTVMLTSFLLCLPTELLLHILSYLSQSELATSMLVCHRIYVVASDPSLWNCVQISHKKNVKDDSFLKISRRKPISLVLAHCSGSISSACLQQILGRMDTLQELTIDTCNFGPFTGDQLLINTSIHCSRLSSVDIRWTQLSNKALSFFSDNCHSLKKISVESVPQISMNTFFLLMKKQRLRLTHVRIMGNMSFSVQDLTTKCVSEGIVCPNVTSFSSNHKIAKQNLKKLFPNSTLMVGGLR